MKFIQKCRNCNRKYDVSQMPFMTNLKCECGGYIISPSGKVQGHLIEDQDEIAYEVLRPWHNKITRDSEGD
jgi:hypothetical protein